MLQMCHASPESSSPLPDRRLPPQETAQLAQAPPVTGRGCREVRSHRAWQVGDQLPTLILHPISLMITTSLSYTPATP
jgi:hypothetical protein